ncbi:MAG: hypothetical protein ACFE9T_04440 [Promethearchaeota archaeon]
MSSMYCPNCKMNVLTSRKDINIPLAILLAIFTGGIGLLIYLAVWYSKENRCIHCKSECQTLSNNGQLNSNDQVQYHNYQIQEYIPSPQKQSEGGKSKFCYNCGSRVADREKAKFCPYCGASVD